MIGKLPDTIPSPQELAALYRNATNANLHAAATIAESAALKLAAGEASLLEAAVLAKFAGELP